MTPHKLSLTMYTLKGGGEGGLETLIYGTDRSLPYSNDFPGVVCFLYMFAFMVNSMILSSQFIKLLQVYDSSLCFIVAHWLQRNDFCTSQSLNHNWKIPFIYLVCFIYLFLYYYYFLFFFLALYNENWLQNPYFSLLFYC